MTDDRGHWSPKSRNQSQAVASPSLSNGYHTLYVGAAPFACPRWGNHFTPFIVGAKVGLRTAPYYMWWYQVSSYRGTSDPTRKTAGAPARPPVLGLYDCQRTAQTHRLAPHEEPRTSKITQRPPERWGRTSGFTTILRARGATPRASPQPPGAAGGGIPVKPEVFLTPSRPRATARST